MSSKHVGVFVVSAVLGCASAGSDDDGGICQDNGTAGCPCVAGGLCLAGLVCDAGVCLPPGGGEEDPGETGGMDGDEGKPIPDMGGEGEEDTGPSMGSCEGACGGQGSGECWCDPSCLGLGDCCDDYAQACPGQCQSNGDCASDEVCSASSQNCESAYGWTYDVWISYWADYADVCWDADSCATPDPFYSIVLGGQLVYVSSVVDDTLMAEWYEPTPIVIDGATTLYFRMEDEDISVDDWILDWGELNGQGAFTAPSLQTLHQGYVIEECWETPLASGTGCYEVEIRFVAQ